MSWTIEQVLSFAPEAATAKRGQTLASERHWRSLEGNEHAIWGECKGSSANFYKTQIDLRGPAFKCNCPSRKFPCKHAIGLLLIFVSRSEAFFIRDQVPEWVGEWLQSRKGKGGAPQPTEKELEQQKKNAESRDKNREKRIAHMQAGVEDLQTWLSDLIRQGLAATEALEYSYWQDISARMVDNKLSGVALKIRSLPLLFSGQTDWPEQLLTELAELYLLGRGVKNLPALPPKMQDQVLLAAGMTIRQDDLLTQDGLADQWMIMGQFSGINIDNGAYRRTWLKGKKTNRDALLLEFDYRNAGFQGNWPVGKVMNAELVFYPGVLALRAAVKKVEFLPDPVQSCPGYAAVEELLSTYSGALAANPWLLDFPALLEQVIPVYSEDQLYVIDRKKKYLPLVSRENVHWKLLALSGGHPVNIFGEWTGRRFVPLSLLSESGLVSL